MSNETSAETGRRYGLKRVCQTLNLPRSSIHAERARAKATVTPITRLKRGPKPRVPDAALLQAIQDDLESSPFTGEGHRKVWARLRILRDIRASRERVLRLMREYHLLSPHRGPRGEANLHDGRITTETPNEMWGTDGVRIQTVDDGLVWVFAAVDHCDGYCAGIHAVKAGDRFAALEPIAQGLQSEFGGVSAAIGAGLTLRMDHGSQYTSEDFRNQLKFWGVTPSYAFVAEPQTNGVAERFNRTMKEQTIHGRIFRNVDEVRDAVVDFKDRYNREWRLEKLGFMSPLEARQARMFKQAA
jgi:putative transposase